VWHRNRQQHIASYHRGGCGNYEKGSHLFHFKIHFYNCTGAAAPALEKGNNQMARHA